MNVTPSTRNPLIYTISGVLIAALVAGGGVYAYQKQQNDGKVADLQAQIDTLSAEVKVAKATPTTTATPVATATPAAVATSTPVATATPTATPALVSTAQWKTIQNSKYKYSVKYPLDWTAQESSGGSLLLKPATASTAMITINQVTRSNDLQGKPFEDYVKVAAANEIQNYQSIATNTQVKGAGQAVGYETTWNYTTLQGQKKVSLPITYFLALGNDTSATDQIMLNDASYTDIYTALIGTYRYANEQ